MENLRKHKLFFDFLINMRQTMPVNVKNVPSTMITLEGLRSQGGLGSNSLQSNGEACLCCISVIT